MMAQKVISMEIIDSDQRRQIIKLLQPLMLPTPHK